MNDCYCHTLELTRTCAAAVNYIYIFFCELSGLTSLRAKEKREVEIFVLLSWPATHRREISAYGRGQVSIYPAGLFPLDLLLHHPWTPLSTSVLLLSRMDWPPKVTLCTNRQPRISVSPPQHDWLTVLARCPWLQLVERLLIRKKWQNELETRYRERLHKWETRFGEREATELVYGQQQQDISTPRSFGVKTAQPPYFNDRFYWRNGNFWVLSDQFFKQTLLQLTFQYCFRTLFLRKEIPTYYCWPVFVCLRAAVLLMP